MLKAGYKQKLHLARFTENGAYLMDEELNEVLLPNRYLTKKMDIGDTVEAFVYHDSEDRIVASTEFPYIMCGEVEGLEVIDISSFGVFLDWGLPKDLFMPRSNCRTRYQKGDVVVVTAYNDNVTGRVVATTKLGAFVSNDTIEVSVGERVRVVVYSKNDVGFRVVVNDKNWGTLYDNQIFEQLELGDSFWGWVTKITPDARIDISMKQHGFDGVKDVASQIIEKLQKSEDRSIPLCDNSSPEDIYEALSMSKKVFKRSIGHLMKQGIVEQRDGKVYLLKLPSESTPEEE